MADTFKINIHLLHLHPISKEFVFHTVSIAIFEEDINTTNHDGMIVNSDKNKQTPTARKRMKKKTTKKSSMEGTQTLRYKINFYL